MFTFSFYSNADHLITVNVTANALDYDFGPLREVCPGKPFNPNESGRLKSSLTAYLGNSYVSGRERPWTLQTAFDKARSYTTAEGAVKGLVKLVQRIDADEKNPPDIEPAY